MFKSKNQKGIIIGTAILVVIVILGIAYAVFTQSLSISGSATGRNSTFRVYFSSLSPVSLTGTAREITAPQIDSNNQTTIGDYSVSVATPGDTVEYTFDVTNSGDYDATLSGLSITSPVCSGTGADADTDATNVCGKLSYTLKYDNGSTVSTSDTLASKETKTMKLKLTYQEFNDASLLAKANVTITGLGVTLTYTQNGNAKVNTDGTTPYVSQNSSYAVGDTITVAGEQYRVIAPSGSSQDYVTALKATPLTNQEVLSAGGSGNGYGGVAYYTSASCRYDEELDEELDEGCTSVYNTSNVKSVVNAWAQAKFNQGDLKQVGNYSVRLITYDELTGLGCDEEDCGNSSYNWLYNSSYYYWTMSLVDGSNAYFVIDTGTIEQSHVYDDSLKIRPVINVYKNKITQQSS